VSNISANNFSPHLFWDIDKENLDFQHSKSQIIYQVVEFGFRKDWEVLKTLYSRDDIAREVVNFRNLDKTTLAFLSVFLQLDKSEFRCYRDKPSAASFWNS
jgi:hypothetical protein